MTSAVIDWLDSAQFAVGAPLGLALADGSLGLAADATTVAAWPEADPVAVVAEVERRHHPRWVWWSAATPQLLVAREVRVARCWDLAAVHRLIHGGWQAAEADVWAAAHGLDSDLGPRSGQQDLLGGDSDDGIDPENPVRPDGFLRPEWTGGGWRRTPDRVARWAAAAMVTHRRQLDRLSAPGIPRRHLDTAYSESAAELLCTELAHDGLPLDLDTALDLLEREIGPAPGDAAEALRLRAVRDDRVLRLIPGRHVDLRSPAQIKELLRHVGIDLPDTRSWRLERFTDVHPVVSALVTWRKAERTATTYGYGWLDSTARRRGEQHRLHGQWSGCDGGAGRMTASSGLHSMPAELRPAIRSDPGWSFVRADLGQIEPRVLAAVSHDPAFAAATRADDLYLPVAQRLGVDRPTAKIAVLAAMYGQTSGAAGEALKGLERAYPVAMRYLTDAHERGRAGTDVHTFGGRLVRMSSGSRPGESESAPPSEPLGDPGGVSSEDRRARLAARGRYARNAVVQGAAAELFKAWAVSVRLALREYDARIVLCLHDELLVHTPAEHTNAVAAVLHRELGTAAARWTGGQSVRFVADVSVVERWSDAKPPAVSAAAR